MKLPRLALALLVLVSCAAAAPTTTLTTSVVSQYMFRGERRGGPALQPWLERRADALTYGLWSSLPLADKVPGQSDPEIDGYASYRFKVADSLGLTPGFTLYGYPRAETARGFRRGTFEPSLALDYTVGGVRLTPTVYHDFQLDGTTAELNASMAVPVRRFGVELDWDATIGTRTERNHANGAAPHERLRGDYASAGVTLPFEVSNHSRLSVSLLWAKGFDFELTQTGRAARPDPLAAGRLVATLGWRYAF